MTATRSLSDSLRHLNRVLLADELTALPDAELVGRFVRDRDDGAFAALVRRHGAVVFGVCRRVLGHEQDAEDAFQATFLVFARDAASVERAGAIGNWLYGVAHNVARKAKTARHRREVKERTAAANQPVAVPAVAPNDLSEVIDAELGQLPDKYRAPIVLCDLMGMTTGEAAAEVGCPAKTLGTRLSRGRVLLGRRLTRRGVAVPAIAIPAILAPLGSASAAVPPHLLDSAARVAVLADPAAVPLAVAALTHGASNVMTHASLKYALLACGFLAVAGLSVRPLASHLHAAHAPARAKPGGGSSAARPVPPPADPLEPFRQFHRFLGDLLPWNVSGTRADDKKDDKEKTFAGVWVKKEGELKIEFAGKNELKISPHGKDDLILILCEYTRDKDTVKAKVTGFEGKEEARKAVAEKLPVGTEFTFKWKVNKDAATLDEVKGEKVGVLQSHLEGEFGERK